MKNTLDALNKRSTLEALKTQGCALLQRGNVSLEEADSFIAVADVLSEGVGTTVPVENADGDSRLELAVMEVDRRLGEANDQVNDQEGQIVPADAVVSMDDDDAVELDQLLDEAEELDALAEYGGAVQEDDGLEPAVALEHFKALVKDTLKRTSISLENIEEAETVSDLVTKVEEVRDIADAYIEKVAESNVEQTTDSLESLTIGTKAVLARVVAHVATVKGRVKESTNATA